MSDALDALAPTAPSAPAPAAPSAVPAPSPAPSAAPPAAPEALAAPPASAPAPVDRAAELQRLATELGFQSADEMRSSLALTRRIQAEHARRQDLERQNDPQHQNLLRRNEAFEQLVSDRYGRDVAEALPALPQLADYLHAQRADGAQADMVGALEELGITFDTSKESLEQRQEWEDMLTDRINANRSLVQRYNGTPQERRDVIRELVAREERRINPVLLKHNAATLRDAAARKAVMPRAGRGGAATPQVRRETPTSTDPLTRRREGRAIDGRALDEIFTYHN